VPNTLLLADDSVTIQRVIELTFADEDVQVIAVSDGDQAIERLQAAPPDIVLADIGMPGKNGYEVAQFVRQTPRLSHIPVVLLTGAFEPVDQARANEAGCDGVLAKPFEPQLVISRVRELLEQARHAPSGHVPELPLNVVPPPAPAPAHEAAAPVEPAAAAESGPESLGDFFDKLDAAFANLPGTRRETTPSEDGLEGEDDLPSFLSPPNSVEPPHAPRPVLRQAPPGFWAAAPPQAPVAAGRPPAVAASTVDQPAGIPQLAAPGASAPVHSTPAPAPEQPMPMLSEAFVTLLAAEQPGAAPASTAAWVRPPVISEELVERVAQRVLERLSERVVRELAGDLISAIAERVVREEIDRIKAAIK